jgi:subtilisin family serine protease
MSKTKLILVLVYYFFWGALYAQGFKQDELIISAKFPIAKQTLLSPRLFSAQTQIFKDIHIKSITPILPRGSQEQAKRSSLVSAQNKPNLPNTTPPYLYLIKFTKQENIKNLVLSLNDANDFYWVQPNYIYHAFDYPNDPHYQANLQWNLDQISCPQAWSVTLSNPQIIVAVIDSGIDFTHEDLHTKIWHNPAETLNSIDDDGNGYIDDLNGWDFYHNDAHPQDQYNHGTHVAGIIGAQTNNHLGIASVAPSCSMMILQASDDQGEFSSVAIYYSLYYAVNNGAHIVNMSFGGTVDFSEDQLLLNGINYALANDVFLVAAAGNSGVLIENNDIVPAKYPGVITVSASDIHRAITTYSNFGSSIDICAPGGNSYYQNPGILSTVPSTNYYKYATISGTSMAAPHVSGVLALLLGAQPTASKEQILAALYTKAIDLGAAGKDNYYGHGLLNAYHSLAYFDTQAPTGNANQYLTSQNITQAILITANITDEFPELIPSVNLYCRYYLHDQPLSAWLQIPMTYQTSFFQAQIPVLANQLYTKIHYYLKAWDLKPNYLTLPSAAPTSNYYLIHIQDIDGPNIEFDAQDQDYFSYQQPFKVTITDINNLNEQSLILQVVEDDAITTTYNLQSQVLVLNNQELTIDLSGQNIDPTSRLTLTIFVADILHNESQKTLVLKQSQSLSIFGPQGEGSPIVNAPNPFNPQQESTYISFQNTLAADFCIYIYSLSLQLVKKFQNYYLPGYHEIAWDGRDQAGDLVPNGVYLCLIKAQGADGKTIHKKSKMVVLY